MQQLGACLGLWPLGIRDERDEARPPCRASPVASHDNALAASGIDGIWRMPNPIADVITSSVFSRLMDSRSGSGEGTGWMGVGSTHPAAYFHERFLASSNVISLVIRLNLIVPPDRSRLSATLPLVAFAKLS